LPFSGLHHEQTRSRQSTNEEVRRKNALMNTAVFRRAMYVASIVCCAGGLRVSAQSSRPVATTVRHTEAVRRRRGRTAGRDRRTGADHRGTRVAREYSAADALLNQPHLNIHDAAAQNEKYTGGRLFATTSCCRSRTTRLIAAGAARATMVRRARKRCVAIKIEALHRGIAL